MFPSIIPGFLARQEQHKDLLRDVEHQRLVRAARFQQAVNRGRQGKVVGWIGVHIVKWASTLHLL